MIIRRANQSDLNDIIQIEQVCFPSQEAASSKELTERFNTFPENFIVATVDEKVVGFINGACTHQPILPDELYHDISLHIPDGKYQTVFGIDVLPDYRHQGIAGQLMNAFIELSKERGKKGIVLTCKNHLIGFYQNFGYVHKGISSSIHGNAQWNDMILNFENERMNSNEG